MDPSRLIFYRILGLVAIVRLVIMLIREMKGRSWDKARNLGWYKETYPNLAGDGWVACFSCSGKNIHIRDTITTTKAVLNSHICQHCGTELYRSVTPK